MSAVQRATVRLGLACDNECVFCGQSGVEGDREPAPMDVVQRALEAARVGHDEVTLVGGEPTLHPELPAVIEHARALGFRAIGLQTNGRRLAPSAVELLQRAGLTDVHLSIHGGSAAAHDYHTGVPGSFVSVALALAAARAARLPVVVTTVLTRSNARGLTEVARWLAARGANAWCIAVPRTRGRAAELFDRVVPRLGVAMPFALHAVQTAESLRLPTFVRGAPLCVLGPFARVAIADDSRAHGEACNACPARAACPGVEPEYLARFAGDELSPREPIAASPDARLVRMFVGSGEVAPPRSSPIAESPARARVALPMAGKVRPAHAEVPRAVEKKTGAALRELFKDLYNDEPRD